MGDVTFSPTIDEETFSPTIDPFENFTSGNSTSNDAIDPLLISFAVIVPVLFLTLSTMILIYWQHPDDRNILMLPKLIVISGLTLAMTTVMVLPLDVANGGGLFGCGSFNELCGNLDMATAWQVMFISVAVYVIVLIPFSIFLYEAYQPGKNGIKQCCEAVQYQAGLSFIVAVIFGLTWGYWNTAQIPIVSYTATPAEFGSCPFTGGNFPDPAMAPACTSSGIINPAVVLNFTGSSWSTSPAYDGENGILYIETSLYIFLVCFMTFIGYFAFSIFVGVGLIILPIDLVKDFIHRPQYMSKTAYLYVRRDIQARVDDAIAVCTSLQSERKNIDSKGWLARRSMNSKTRNIVKKLKTQVIQLEDEYDELVLCHEQWKNYNPLIPICKLIMGIFGAIISCFWIVHIFLFMLARYPWPSGPPISYFLNDAFSWALQESGFGLLGVILVGIFSFYLFFCLLKGSFRIGVRFFIFEVHPMKYGGTYMNSFLVNLSIILLCTPALVMFCAAAFAEFIAASDLDTINAQIVYMETFSYFFYYLAFTFLLLFCSFTSVMLFIYCPDRSRAATAKKLKESIAKFENYEQDAKLAELEEKKKQKEEEKKKSKKKAGGPATAAEPPAKQGKYEITLV